MSAKALEYAEHTLGVHTVYETANTAITALQECLTQLAIAKDQKRNLEFSREDLEQEILSIEWTKHPDMAQSRMDKHFKSACHRNDEWLRIRSETATVQGQIDHLEGQKLVHEATLKVAASRLQELGGYLSYLAAVKSAVNTSESGESK